MAIDPVTLEIEWNRLITLMDEVDAAVVRTSFSTIVGESRDFAVIMLDEQGRSLAQSQLSSPAFTCMLPATTKHLLAQFPRESLRPGDVLITNDPWIGTGHLPDLSIVMPVFVDERAVGFMATAAHVADIGGRLDFFDGRDVYEEGLRIPPSKLLLAGSPNEQLLRVIEANVRVPGQVLGDIFSIVGAEHVGAARLSDFVRECGAEHFRALASEILGRSEAAMRGALRGLPDGEYQYEVVADGYHDPVTIHVRLTLADGSLQADFAGSSSQFAVGSINCVLNTTFADTYYPIKCSLTPEIPNNEGLFRPLQVIAPEGSVLNTTFPSPVRTRSKTSFHIHMAIYGALAQAMPERIQAGSGSFWSLRAYGHGDDGAPYSVSVLPNGGKGATVRADGLSTIAFPYNGTVTPAEVIENQAPLRVEAKRLVANSGGAGRNRGGLGQEIVYRCTGGRSLIVVVRPDKVDHPPAGVLGGCPGMAGRLQLNGEVVGATPHRMAPGDRLTVRLPGGGGYGDPLERDPVRVAEDVRQGYLTAEAAAEDYAVVLEPGSGDLDAAATAFLRQGRRH